MVKEQWRHGPEPVPDSLASHFHFSGDISNGSLCVEVSLICRHQFPLLCLWIITYMIYLRSLQGLGTLDLFDNFLKCF